MKLVHELSVLAKITTAWYFIMLSDYFAEWLLRWVIITLNDYYVEWLWRVILMLNDYYAEWLRWLTYCIDLRQTFLIVNTWILEKKRQFYSMHTSLMHDHLRVQVNYFQKKIIKARWHDLSCMKSVWLKVMKNVWSRIMKSVWLRVMKNVWSRVIKSVWLKVMKKAQLRVMKNVWSRIMKNVWSRVMKRTRSKVMKSAWTMLNDYYAEWLFDALKT